MHQQKEKAALLQQRDHEQNTHELIIADAELIRQVENLRDTLYGKVPAKEVVKTLRQEYPGFDKTLLSKCENPEKYGVVLYRHGMRLLLDTFPEITKDGAIIAHGNHKSSGHKFTCRIQARLPDEQYSELQQYIRSDGYGTMQDWISDQVRRYLKRKRKEQIK